MGTTSSDRRSRSTRRRAHKSGERIPLARRVATDSKWHAIRPAELVASVPSSRFPLIHLTDSLRLIAITDDLRDGIIGLVGRAEAAVRGGATMVQLRLTDVDPRELVAITGKLVASVSVPVLVHDRADVALAAGAAGVHVGVDDVPAFELRRVMPPMFVIGASVGNETDLSSARGADYVGIGPVFGAGAKLDSGAAIGVKEFARLARLAAVPAIAIGGIDESNCRQVRDAGAAGVAVIRTIFAAADPEHAALALSSAIGS